MEETITKKRICPLCGKTIHYRIVNDDGVDWLGHQRGSSRSDIIGYECECDSITFKKMCLNCTYYNSDTCTNKNVVQEYKKSIEKEDSPFALENISISIKKPTNACKCWAVNNSIASKFFN